jgi:hypothetical protein
MANTAPAQALQPAPPATPQGYGTRPGYVQMVPQQPQSTQPAQGIQTQQSHGQAAAQIPAQGYSSPAQNQNQYQEESEQPQEQDLREQNDGKVSRLFNSATSGDFKVVLRPPTGENSAEMQGKYSFVRCTLSSNGKSVHHNFPIYVLDAIHAETVQRAFAPRQPSGLKLSQEALSTLETAKQAIDYALGCMQQGQSPWQATADAATYLQAVLAGVANGSQGNTFSYNQVKVNPSAEVGAITWVTTISITRNEMKGKELAKYPWTIVVENFDAKKALKGKMAHFTGEKFKVRRFVLTVSDEDMFAMANKALRYRAVWDQSTNYKIIRAATERRYRKEKSYWK